MNFVQLWSGGKVNSGSLSIKWVSIDSVREWNVFQVEPDAMTLYNGYVSFSDDRQRATVRTFRWQHPHLLQK